MYQVFSHANSSKYDTQFMVLFESVNTVSIIITRRGHHTVHINILFTLHTILKLNFGICGLFLVEEINNGFLAFKSTSCVIRSCGLVCLCLLVYLFLPTSHLELSPEKVRTITRISFSLAILS